MERNGIWLTVQWVFEPPSAGFMGSARVGKGTVSWGSLIFFPLPLSSLYSRLLCFFWDR